MSEAAVRAGCNMQTMNARQQGAMKQVLFTQEHCDRTWHTLQQCLKYSKLDDGTQLTDVQVKDLSKQVDGLLETIISDVKCFKALVSVTQSSSSKSKPGDVKPKPSEDAPQSHDPD